MKIQLTPHELMQLAHVLVERDGPEASERRLIEQLQDDVRALRVKRANAYAAGEKKGESHRQLLQAKLDGTAVATDTMLGKMCYEALKLLGEWVASFPFDELLASKTREFLTMPRVPK
jgi:hypothetical protein